MMPQTCFCREAPPSTYILYDFRHTGQVIIDVGRLLFTLELQEESIAQQVKDLSAEIA